jgi:4-amino-4-deoxy-L-arabinose transferase-like glycosyltransferase
VNSTLQSLRHKWTFFAILAMGIAFRLYDLGGPSLWTDEGITRWFAALPMGRMQEALRLDFVNLPLFFTLENWISGILGDSEVALRFTSAAFGMLCIPVVYRVGTRAAGSVGGLAASGFWALHPMTIWYSREARPYALSTLLALISLWMFFRLREKESTASWLGVGITFALGLINHYYFILVPASLTLLALAEIRSRPLFFRKWALVNLAAGIPLALLLGWYLSQPDPRLTIAWIQQPGLKVFPKTLANLLTGYGGELSIVNIAGMLASSTLLLLGVKRGLYGRLAALGILVPVLAVWVISQRRPLYMDRYFIVLLPFLALLIGRGAAQLQDVMIQRSAAMPLLIWPLLLALAIVQGSTVHTAAKYRREDFRSASELITAAPAPVWLSETPSILPFSYYHGEAYEALHAPTAEACGSRCWWILRQPYTPTHAFTQAITDPERPWLPDPPSGCTASSLLEDGAGIALWRVSCKL